MLYLFEIYLKYSLIWPESQFMKHFIWLMTENVFLFFISGCLFCWTGRVVYDNELELHHHWLDNRQWQCSGWPLGDKRMNVCLCTWLCMRVCDVRLVSDVTYWKMIRFIFIRIFLPVMTQRMHRPTVGRERWGGPKTTDNLPSNNGEKWLYFNTFDKFRLMLYILKHVNYLFKV